MSFKSTSKLVFTRAAGLYLSLGALVGCTAYPTFKNLPLDCDVEAGYEFEMVNTFDTVRDDKTPWTATDTPAGVSTSAVEPLTEGGRCGSTAALVLRTSHNNDWGSIFIFAPLFATRDASAYEGIAFWARAPGGSTKGFTILLDDPNTSTLDAPVAPSCGTTDSGIPAAPQDAGARDICTKYCSADAGTSGSTGTADPNGMMMGSAGSGAATAPEACGNSYTTVAVVTTEWRLYTIPFSTFQQSATANKVPNALLNQTGPVVGNGMRTSALKNLILRMPKEANMELWMDNLSFYRKKGQVAGGDGGTATQM